MLAEHTLSGLGRELALTLVPLSNPRAVEPAMQETTEARDILDAGAQVPLWGLADVRPLVQRAQKGGTLQAADLLRVADCMRGCAEFKRYMHGKQDKAPRLSLYAAGIVPLKDLTSEINACIQGSRVADSASSRLAKVRKELRIVEDRIKARLQSILTSPKYREALQESLVTIRGDRYAIPVKASHRHKLAGAVVDSSGSGMTVYIEPAAVGQLNEELRILRSQEEAEEYQILSALSALVAEHAAELDGNLKIMALYDLAFAKGRLSIQMDGQPVAIRNDRLIQLLGARHPLIGPSAVPLDIVLGRQYRTLVITGPNTGGKTVALKTAGLLALMAQSGLHLPVAEGSAMPVFDQVLPDIGDIQSISQSLSTFSGHLKQISAILAQATPASLVLLDEIGTGTDPAEGAALAKAILEELHGFGCLTMASTHYGDVKRLAEQHPGFVNGRMDFDRDTLKPLYRLVIGEAGESQALWIAGQLGLSRRLIARAREHLATGPVQMPDAGAAANKPPEQVVAVEPRGGSVEGRPATRAAPSEDLPTAKRPWRLGDSVVLEDGQQGVIAVLPDERGQVVVFSRGRRVTAHQRRVKLLIGAEHLYPEGYDLRTVLFTWGERQTINKVHKRGTEVVGSSPSSDWVKTDALDVDRRK